MIALQREEKDKKTTFREELNTENAERTTTLLPMPAPRGDSSGIAQAWNIANGFAAITE